MSEIKVTFNRRNEPKINGKRTTPHRNGNHGRTVYICDEYVLKIDDRGYSHEDMETWKTIEKRDHKYFVPTLEQGETEDGVQWSIQPYIELDDNITDEAQDIIARLVDKYNLFDIDYWETSNRNWAMHNGQPIIFDYGLMSCP